MIYLYVKTHNKTGLKYFGKTTNEDPSSYKGSGKYWTKHLKKNGYDFSTEIIAEFDDEDIEKCTKFAIEYSIAHDIVNSEEWANLCEENGLDGAPKGHITSEETKNKISKSLIGKSFKKSKYEIKENREIRSKRQSAITKNTFWVNNGEISKRVREIEDGWILGRLEKHKLGNKDLGLKNKSGNNTRGKVIYNNGIRHAFFIEGTAPPGWVRGKMDGFQGGTGSLKKGKNYGEQKIQID